MKAGFKPSTGRVIALGRLLIATLLLIAILVDPLQPTAARVETYALLSAYVVLAFGLTIVTWRNWWLDVMLAAPGHALDISLFTLLVFSTAGYTSPYFTFFVFLLLSAAIRWGWRETALTAGLVTGLYLIAGLLVARSGADFELQRFLVRSGHLVILSAILIWFGVNQRITRSIDLPDGLLGHPALDETPTESILRAAAQATSAKRAVLAWAENDGEHCDLLVLERDELAGEQLFGIEANDRTDAPFLYDLARDRGLEGDPRDMLHVLTPSNRIPGRLADRARLKEGLAVPIRSESGRGMLFLEGISNLSTDFLDVGDQLAAGISGHFQRSVLIKAMEESSEAAARIVVARDLHDSVVQFLAGTAFRLEAMIRSGHAGPAIEAELQELKRLVLLEQRDLRHFIAALRSGGEIPSTELVDDLADLTAKLGRQWGIRCVLKAQLPETIVPMRLRLDAHQLVREAVANAVRHGHADRVKVSVSSEDNGQLRLEVRDNGIGFPERAPSAFGTQTMRQPWSLRERVLKAGGAIVLESKPKDTRVSISLPTGERSG